jgi:hypothetical protein
MVEVLLSRRLSNFCRERDVQLWLMLQDFGAADGDKKKVDASTL